MTFLPFIRLRKNVNGELELELELERNEMKKNEHKKIV